MKGVSMTDTEKPIELGGVHHLALVCSDMARTVEFYQRVLGLRLIKTVELPAGMGQHFFFDIGSGDTLAFFWFTDGPGPAPGLASPKARPDNGESTSAVASMNHVAFQVAPERLEEYRQRLMASGVECSVVVHHDDSEWTVTDDMHPGVFLSSVYFQDPDGILLEMAAWTKVLDESDVRHQPATVVRRPVTAGSKGA
jgi:catechol 2,3-dioxygenase-like lactoylglutathione lyase family enzyme